MEVRDAVNLGDIRRLRVLLNEAAAYATKARPELRAECYRFLMGTCVKRLKKPIDVKSHHTKTYFIVCAKNWFIITLHKEQREK